MKQVLFIDTPCGRMGIAATDRAVTAIFFCRGARAASGKAVPAVRPGNAVPAGMLEGDTPLLQQAARELEEYFAGTRHTFTFPIAAEGTPFQRAVWEVLRSIPYGETRSYAEVAALAGRPRASRAVGMANHCNPLPIVIPCHRVIGANGRLTGYAGGLDVKTILLNLERQ